MATRRQHKLPDQDIDEIRECVLAEADGQGMVSEGDLFVDPFFPPDQSSLNFVYSGDDKYERMVYKRPKVQLSPFLTHYYGTYFYIGLKE